MRRRRCPTGLAGQPGFILVESVVAVGIMGVLGVGLLAGAAIGVKSTAQAEWRLVAESLARRQMEEIKAAPFAAGGYAPLPALPADFAVTIGVQGVPGADASLQRIDVVVLHAGRAQAAATGFKLDR